MLGFTLPLLVFGGLEGVIAILLLLPLPFCRPAILICKLTRTHAGRTVVITISIVLIALLLAPLYDLIHLHDRPEDTAGASSERRYGRFICLCPQAEVLGYDVSQFHLTDIIDVSFI